MPRQATVPFSDQPLRLPCGVTATSGDGGGGGDAAAAVRETSAPTATASSAAAPRIIVRALAESGVVLWWCL